MFRFASPLLPSTITPPGSAPLARIVHNATDVIGAPLLRVDYGTPTPQVQTGETPAAIGPGRYRIPITDPTTRIETVVIGGVTYIPADDISNPQPGEYYYDPYQKVIIIASDQPITGAPYYLETTPIEIPTNLVRQPYPDWLAQLPITGDISWDLQLNAQPSGSANLEIIGDSEEHKTILQSGLPIDLWGVGIVLSQPQVSEEHRRNAPFGRSTVQASLSGLYEWQASQPAYWLGSTTFSGGTQVIECSPIGGNPPAPATLSTGTTVQALAAQLGVKIDGPIISVRIPDETEQNDTTDWTTYLETGRLYNRSYVDWTDPNAVKILPYDRARTWTCIEPQIDGAVQVTLQQADAAPERRTLPRWRVPNVDLRSPFPDTVVLPQLTLQPEQLNLKPVFSYKDNKIQGIFVESQNDSNPSSEANQLPTKPPEWRQVPSVSKVLEAGDPDPATAPGNPTHLSNNADVSGITKRRVVTLIINGATVQELTWIYGWMFTGEDLKSGDVSWGVVDYRNVQYISDATGYELGNTVTGYKMLRQKIETTDNPETLSESDTGKKALYQYRQVALRGGKSVKLRQIRDYYKSYKVSPPYTIYEICSANGTKIPVAVYDPTWVEPMFVAEEVEWTRAIDFAPNPDSTPENPLPELKVGEESYTYRRVEPIAIQSGDGVLSQDPDGYRQYSIEFRAQEAGFGRSLEQAPFEEYLGIPSEAPRGKSAYELQEQAQPDNQTEPENTTNLDYYIRSAGYDGRPMGSLSFDGTNNLEQFTAAARTNLLERRHNTLQETVKLSQPNFEIRPGDLFVYDFNGFRRKRRVLGVKNAATIQGMERRIITGSTELTLGVDLDNSVSISAAFTTDSQHKNPPPTVDANNIYYPGRTLGEIKEIPTSRFRY